ncbi:MAG: hypothetical protein Q8K75_07755 [Chlamydiales bacterium]|nr:hypothetical protein [Chlamydiales bacterium]
MKADVNSLQEYLSSLDIESFVLPASDLAAVDQLDVPIGADEQNRQRRIVVMVDKEQTDEEEGEQQDDEEKADAVHIVKFLGVMPIEVKPELVSDVARMVCFLNHIADIPGFLLSEPLTSVYFLYGLACPGGVIDPKQFVSTLGLVGTMVDLYQPFIENVSTGKTPVDKVIAGEIEM